MNNVREMAKAVAESYFATVDQIALAELSEAFEQRRPLRNVQIPRRPFSAHGGHELLNMAALEVEHVHLI